MRVVYFAFIPLTVLGLIGNLPIIFFMPMKSVKLSSTMKFYYISIAIADFIDLLVNLLWIGLTDSLNVITNFQFSINIASQNDFNCKVFGSLWILSETYSNYSVIALSIERMVAIYLPYKSKLILNKKFTFFIYSITVFPVSVSLVVMGALIAKVAYIPGISSTGYDCSSYNPSHPLFKFYEIAFPVGMFIIHEAVNFLLFVVILIGVFRSIKERNNLMKQDSMKATYSKAINFAITVLLMILINYSVYLPTFFFEILYAIIRGTDAGVSVIIGNLYTSFLSLLVLAHSVNIFVYYFRIPSFKKIINDSIPFCKKELHR